MRKNLLLAFALTLIMSSVNASETVFDSMGNATEVKLAPAIKSSSATVSTTPVSSTSSAYTKTSIKEEKLTNAITNLDDVQVELRQELADKTAQYNTAVAEKQKAIQNCKVLKAELREINKKMKDVDVAKQKINKNI